MYTLLLQVLCLLWPHFLLVRCHVQPFEVQPKGIAKTWTMQGRADLNTLIHLKIALVNPKSAAFEDLALKIATPFSGHYRKHLSAAELSHWVSPPPSDVKKIQQWLSKYNIDSEQKHDLVVATTTIPDIQSLLNTTYYNYEDSHNRIVQRTPQYFVPANLAHLIDSVHPTVNFPFKRHPTEVTERDTTKRSPVREISAKKRTSKDPCDSDMTTPACINKVYNATYTAPYSSNITMVDLATGGSLPNKTNLKLYLEQFNPLPLKRKDYILSKAVGGDNGPPTPADIFDSFLQLIMGHGGTLRGSADGINGAGAGYLWGPRKNQKNKNSPTVKKGEQDFVDYLHYLAHADGVPSVVSQSEYLGEAELTVKYMRYVCNVYARATARGVTFLQQVNDYGSGAIPNNKGIVVFETAFPSTCSFVAGVGATVWDPSDHTEKAATWQTRHIQAPSLVATSSGVFSQVFPRPKYQDALVPGYVKKYKLAELYENNPNTTGFVSTGRALPDFSVFGAKIPFVKAGRVVIQNSPVIAAPIAAGFIGRLNAYEQSKGRPLLGNVNPFFYQNPHLFTDITCCGNNGVVVEYPIYRNYSKVDPYGFPVAEGWDAVTGLGSFKFAAIQKALDDMAAAGALD